MTINPIIQQTFAQYNVPYDEGMLYLLSIHYGIPLSESLQQKLDVTIKQVNISHIVERDYENEDIKWIIPLFSDHDNNWDWVLKEYRQLFMNINKERAGSPSSCIKRMKAFFATHPEIRKDDVINAAKTYISSLNDPMYLMQADYFIFKGSGKDQTSKLEQYLEIIKVKNEVSSQQLKMMGD